MTKQTKKRVLPDDEQIKAKLDNLDKLAEQAIAGDYGNNKTTVTDKLDLVRNILEKFKGKNVTYSTIVKVLEEGVDLKVSEQTLRKYCQDKLGWPKRAKKKNKNNNNTDTISDEIDNSSKANFSARENLSSETEFD